MAAASAAELSPTELADESLYRYVWKTAWALLRDENDASDIAQEALLRTLKYLKRRDPNRATKLRFYVAVIARRLATDLLAVRERIAGRRVKFTHAEDEERYWANVADQRHESPPSAAMRSENASRVNAAVEQLPSLTRRVVRAYYFDHQRQVDIGAECGLPKCRVNEVLRKSGFARMSFELRGVRDTCEGCGNSFPAQYGREQRYCTKQCLWKARRRRQILRQTAGAAE